ncbi:MAG: ribosome small subunit-dependent GTPase A [Acidimicrobiales bacterium]|nr:ribosome small subunit-dependent GTPase A [Acidimicrobiales bacterium]
MPASSLDSLGWPSELDPHLHAHPSLTPARVAVEGRGGWTVVGPAGELLAEASGRLRHRADPLGLPAVGDWVMVAPRPDEGRATIHAVLPRRTALVRKVTGSVTAPQVVAANVDTVLVIVPLDVAINPRLLERQLALVWESGAAPVVVAAKADLVGPGPELERALDRLRDAALGTDVLALSSTTGAGVGALGRWLQAGATLALLGRSGAGKSTLANRLLGEERLATGTVRAGDGRGRHTTSRRELVTLPSGALLIDTPGLRELALWGDEGGVTATFRDLDDLAAACRFADCGHRTEPGCAVLAAVDTGALDPERLDAWRKLQRELAHLARRQDAALAAQERRRWAALTRDGRRRARP